MNFDPRSYWLQGQPKLLLKAAYHADRSVAFDAWREWEASVDFETAPWAELRVAAVAIRKLGKEAESSRFGPRLAGMRRFVWSSVMTRIEGARPLLERLSAAGVPMLLIKGGARIAQDPGVVAERFIQDVDVLIAFDSWAKAVDVVFEHGYPNAWKLDRDTFANRMHQVHHSLGVIVSPPYEVDLHHFSIPLNRQLGADDDLWKRARQGALFGIPAMLPHPSDQLAITLSHAIRYLPTPAFEWVGDALTHMSATDFAWDTFEQVVDARELAPHTVAGLSFMREELAAPVPSEVIARLLARVREPFVTELDAYHTGWGGEIDAEHHCHAFMEAEAVRCANALPRLPRGVDVKTSRRSRSWPAQIGLGGASFCLPVPKDIAPADIIRLDIWFRRQHRGYAEVLVRCFDDFILEFARSRFAEELAWYERFLSSKMSLRLPGSLLIGRGIVELKVTVRPSEKAIWLSRYCWSAEKSVA
jgi:hypothetical protein